MNNENKKFYSYKKNKKIKILDDFYNFHRENFGHKKNITKIIETSINSSGGSKNINYNKISDKFSKKISSVKLPGFISKAVQTYQLVELFKQTRFQIPYGKTLDIGCGLGFHLRLLKAWGFIERAVGIDVYDICSGFNENKFKKQHSKFKKLKYIEKLQNYLVKKSVKKELNIIEKLIIKKIPTVRNFSKNYGHYPDESIYNQTFKNRPSIDKLVIGDIYDYNDKFDLVTSFASLDWFKADEIIPKIYDLTNEGGFFYLWVSNWFHSVNTTNLFGHFPFASQRMSKEEYFEYCNKFMPEHLETIKDSYNYFDPSHPTLSDYIEIANEAGFIALNWKENIMPDPLVVDKYFSSLGVQEYESEQFHEAWKDIKQKNPKLRKRDMMAFTNSILFYKPPLDEKKNRMERYNSLKEKEIHFRPKGFIGKMIKSVLEKYFLT